MPRCALGKSCTAVFAAPLGTLQTGGAARRACRQRCGLGTAPAQHSICCDCRDTNWERKHRNALCFVVAFVYSMCGCSQMRHSPCPRMCLLSGGEHHCWTSAHICAARTHGRSAIVTSCLRCALVQGQRHRDIVRQKGELLFPALHKAASVACVPSSHGRLERIFGLATSCCVAAQHD